MFRLYSEKKAEAILGGLEETLREIAGICRLPKACLRAVLFREITHIDILDIPADAAVRFYWFRRGLRETLCRLGLLKDPTPRLNRGVFGKKDSSTGYAQIFARVAIEAVNFACDRGVVTYAALGLPERRHSPARPEDLRYMWRRLVRDRRFNLTAGALNLLSAAEEMTGRTDFDSFSPEELQLVFTRYNADTRQITAYGRDVYQRYLRYRDQEKDTTEAC